MEIKFDSLNTPPNRVTTTFAIGDSELRHALVSTAVNDSVHYTCTPDFIKYMQLGDQWADMRNEFIRLDVVSKFEAGARWNRTSDLIMAAAEVIRRLRAWTGGRQEERTDRLRGFVNCVCQFEARNNARLTAEILEKGQ